MSRYSITVDGKEIAKDAVLVSENKDYEQLVDYVENLPKVSQNEIAILKNDAVIEILDEAGNVVTFEPGKESYDFINGKNAIAEIPKEISAEIDVLTTAHNWSLFMSNDKKFAEIKGCMIKDSYQYKKALQYATGIDITFTSPHTLRDPAFTENKVTNFTWIADNCFSVDVSFVKHMLLVNGKKVDDAMNHRIYFVKYDDSDDGNYNPTWKIASMKEIIEDGNE